MILALKDANTFKDVLKSIEDSLKKRISWRQIDILNMEDIII